MRFVHETLLVFTRAMRLSLRNKVWLVIGVMLLTRSRIVDLWGFGFMLDCRSSAQTRRCRVELFGFRRAGIWAPTRKTCCRCLSPMACTGSTCARVRPW